MKNKEAYLALKEEFIAKYKTINKALQKDYVAFLVYLGASGEYQNDCEYSFPRVINSTRIQYQFSVPKALKELQKLGLIEKDKYDRKNIWKLTDPMLFLIVCDCFKCEFSNDSDYLDILHNINQKQNVYGNKYWGTEVKADSFIRAIFFSDTLKVDYLKMIGGFESGLDDFSRELFLPLFNTLLLEDTAKENVLHFLNRKDVELKFINFLLSMLNKTQLPLDQVQSCFENLGQNFGLAYGQSLSKLLGNQFEGQFLDKNDIAQLPQELQQSYIAKQFLFGGEDKKLLQHYLEIAGIDVSKDIKKKSSKHWKSLSMYDECFFLLTFVNQKPLDCQFLRNRIKYLTKIYKNNPNHSVLTFCIDLALLLKEESDLNISYSEKELEVFTQHFWGDLRVDSVYKLHPMVLALTLYLSKRAFPNVLVREEIYTQIANVFLLLIKNRLNLYARCFVDPLEKMLNHTYNVYFDVLKNKIPFSFGQLLEADQSEEWEKVLSKVEQLADRFEELDGKKKDTKGVKDEIRLVWAVDTDDLSVIACEQSRLKNGKWGKLKSISDKRLVEKNVKGALPIDLEILKHAYKKYSSSYYYGSTVQYNPIEIWKRLEGHPNVVLETNIDMPVTVSKVQVEIKIEEVKEGYRMSIAQDIDFDFPVKKETPSRYTYYNVDDKIKTWVETFPDGAIFPKQAKDRLKAVVGQLSRSLEVHSKTEDIKEELPEISADTKIHALLTPKGNDILLNLYMKPFADIPPYVVPAKGKEDLVEEIERIRTRAVRNFEVEKKKIRDFFKERPILENTDEGNYTWQFEEREDLLNALEELEFGGEKPIIEWPKGVKFKLLASVDVANLSLQVKTKKVDWFGVEGELKVNEQVVVSLLHLLAQFKENPNLKYIEVSDGQFITMTSKLRRQISAMSQLATPTKKGLQIHKMASVGLMDTLRESNLEADNKWIEFEKQIETANKKRFILPKNLNAELRNYQTEGFKWLSRLDAWGGGACLADDMGLGKTLQGISVLLNKAKEGASLVIAPSSVGFNWVKEINKFAPSLKPSLLVNAPNREELVKKAKKNDVIICSYGLLQTGAEYLTEKEWNIVILDEAQAIKNKGTKRSKEAMKLQARSKIAMTGTPIENNLAELWNLFQFINPGLLGSWEQFNQNFVLRITSEDDQHAHTARQVLRNIIKPFLLRRNKNEVLDELPSKTEIVLDVEMSEAEQTYYEALRRTALDEIEDIMSTNEKNGTLQVLAELTKLRQACCHISLLDHEMHIESSKLNLFLEIVDELKAGGHRALVFSQFVGFLDLVRLELDKSNISYQYLDGSTSMKNREKAVEAFQDGEGDVFLISLKAGGTGLNLTAADYVIHLDPWWNPAVEDQATDRAYRIGQERPVTVYRLITQNTIEEKMIRLHHEKRQLADDLLSGSSIATKLNAKELLKLLSND